MKTTTSSRWGSATPRRAASSARPSVVTMHWGPPAASGVTRARTSRSVSSPTRRPFQLGRIN
ncbi:hypothetical protein H2136_06980 [Aeromonas hydrophila]|uniref:Uncharacterized protein n=1 Tax=Aeromonas hydrophila TaxID=644 RepID=A0A926FPJ9_AERHY|nr:hypothetical protein [Aeromonas hydrophila]